MNEARKEAKQLVQGTLLPVVTPSGILRLLHSYESGYGILSNFLLILWDPGSKPLQRESHNVSAAVESSLCLTRRLRLSVNEH
ncbi:hypothetical protein JG688_00018510 [Phytophthora aleatoria]|uniref:Uncharacterized protein n=1 Tax=Phytophthora aleatoria TaxID=2496075 RepID=A0A8J5I2A1_9STRA|nr:hypothetical protein JG688_00018510 [Phytophthora aleatoria]